MQERLDKASAATRAKAYLEAIPLLESVYSEKLPPDLEGLRANVAYGLACTFARLGKPDQALEALARAAYGGFTDVEHARADEDLASLRAHPKFETLLSEMRKGDHKLRIFHVTSWMNPDLPLTAIRFDSLENLKTVSLREHYSQRDGDSRSTARWQDSGPEDEPSRLHLDTGTSRHEQLAPLLPLQLLLQ